MASASISAQAANDQLWSPSTSTLPAVTEIEQVFSVLAPNQEVQKYAAAYEQAITAIQATRNTDAKSVTKEQEAKDKLLHYMKLRAHFYEWTHQWTPESYANIALKNMVADYEKLLTSKKGTLTQDQLLQIEAKHMENVYNAEVRSYANEILVFSLKETLKDMKK